MTIDETGIIERREPYEQPAVIRLPVVLPEPYRQRQESNAIVAQATETLYEGWGAKTIPYEEACERELTRQRLRRRVTAEDLDRR